MSYRPVLKEQKKQQKIEPIKEPESKNEVSKRTIFLFKPVPLYFLILVFLPLFSIGYHFIKPEMTNSTKYTKPEIQQNKSADNSSATIIRQDEGSLTRPLLFVDIKDEQIFTPSKKKILSFIEEKKKEGVITTASVYLNDLNTACHIEINPNELYDPASILKVSTLIIYLKKAESDPALLKKRYVFNESNENFTANIKDKSLEKGKSYSVEELLQHMIAYSDNQAYFILARNVDFRSFDELNKELKIPVVSSNSNMVNSTNFVANVNSVSRFFRVLYSATYLNRKMSEYALNLLTQSTYKDGILKGIDPSVRVAHKFGERMDFGVAQLHEFGIVYLDNRPYLIGVMTKGRNLDKLREVVSSISKIAYEDLKRI
jgi:beta-lactamase class A